MIRQGYSLNEKKAIADASKYYDEKLQQAPGNVRYNHFQVMKFRPCGLLVFFALEIFQGCSAQLAS